MPTLYNQYIYKDNEWKLVGLSRDTVTQSLLLSGNTLTLVGSDGSTSTATINTGELENISVNGTIVTIVDGVANITVPTVSASADLSTGTKIGTITINGTGTDLYAPAGSSAPASVSGTTLQITTSLSSGDEVNY